MKLIPLLVLITSMAMDAKTQKFRQEQFPFPPQFQTAGQGRFPTDNSLYLPPEAHAPIPYFPIKNVNGLHFPYLPPTGTKAPSVYPTPFPLMISSSFAPNFDDNDEDEDGTVRMSTPRPQVPQRHNQTDTLQNKENNEMRPSPKIAHFPQAIDRNDGKFPMKFTAPSASTSFSFQNPPSRRMIISADTHRNDVMGLDQLKAGALHGSPFLQAAPGIFVSSTTEPAIPILRLSNEMDLDGSFSYEALGADQTHYVQHSRMENVSPDKQEQVVEGSYSYIGDNGQTYTVHYIADSNGFRASGDHLPVAPPIPEIIQRAVQYNLAEDAKKPPHLRTWQEDGRDNEINDSDKNYNYAPPQPPRNLFTGRTPEAFSYSYQQGSNTQNNLVTSASNQAPVKTVDYTTEQSKAKPNNGPISPQITFLASQGAHVPSMNTVQSSISRMFTTEKTILPQLLNYEAGGKESDQESNKALWRWQYGLTANKLAQNANKDTISRSFGEGDDIEINFSNMTPEQYTNMIRSQFESNHGREVQNQITQSNVNTMNKESQLEQRQSQSSNQNNYIENTPAISDSYQSKVNNEHKYNFFRHFNDNLPKEKQYQNLSRNNYINNLPLVIESEVTKVSNQDQSNLMRPFYQNTEPNQVNHKEYENTFSNQNIKNQHSATERQQSMVVTKPTVTFPPHSEELNRKAIYNSQFQTSINTEETHKNHEIKPKLLTQKDFVFPSQTVTQDYNFEDTFYEPRKIKAIYTDVTSSPTYNYGSEMATHVFDSNATPNTIENDIKIATNYATTVPSLNTANNFEFTDFIIPEKPNEFRTITTSTTKTARSEETSTESVENIIENNFFLKNLFKPENVIHKNQLNSDLVEGINKQSFENIPIEIRLQTNENELQSKDTIYPNQFQPENVEHVNQFIPGQIEHIKVYKLDNINRKTEQKSMDTAKTESAKIDAEPKTDKIPKLVQFIPKPNNDIKTFKKKPGDIAEILNYVSMKNHMEFNKIKPRNKPVIANNFDSVKDDRFIPVHQERNEEIETEQTSYRPLNREQQEELRGILKNYKVLQRKNNVNNKHENSELRRELSPPPFVSPSLPPLGRAGPSMKSYLPPIYV